MYLSIKEAVYMYIVTVFYGETDFLLNEKIVNNPDLDNCSSSILQSFRPL